MRFTLSLCQLACQALPQRLKVWPALADEPRGARLRGFCPLVAQAARARCMLLTCVGPPFAKARAGRLG